MAPRTRGGSSSGCGGALIAGRASSSSRQPLHGAGRALQLAPHFRERRRRAADEGGVDQELRELPAGHRSASSTWCAPEPQHDDDAPRTRGQMPTPVSTALTRVRRTAAAKLSSTAPAIALALQLLQRECLHRLDRVQGLAGEAARVRDPVLRGARQAAHAAADDDERHDHHGNQHQNDARELRAGDREQDQRDRPGSRSIAG